jgi:hypothetical protein
MLPLHGSTPPLLHAAACFVLPARLIAPPPTSAAALPAHHRHRPAAPPPTPQVNQEESELVYRAPMAVEVDDDAFASCEVAMERLLDLDDVDAVYTNADGLA